MSGKKQLQIYQYTKIFKSFLKKNKLCRNHRNVHFSKLNNTICFREGKNEFYLRFKPQTGWPENSIVIARIGFSEQRVGHGTNFLRFLVEHSQKYGIDNIFIEYANENCGKFAQKYGFTRWSNDHWYITSTLLKSRL